MENNKKKRADAGKEQEVKSSADQLLQDKKKPVARKKPAPRRPGTAPVRKKATPRPLTTVLPAEKPVEEELIPEKLPTPETDALPEKPAGYNRDKKAKKLKKQLRKLKDKLNLLGDRLKKAKKKGKKKKMMAIKATLGEVKAKRKETKKRYEEVKEEGEQ